MEPIAETQKIDYSVHHIKGGPAVEIFCLRNAGRGMGARKLRMLLCRLGEGHKGALLNLARTLSEAGFEVIYTDLQEPEAIVSSALQESVDHIGITTLPGADIEAFREISRLLREAEADHITVTAGGYLDDKDIPQVKGYGVGAFFPKGTTFRQLVEWAKENITISRPGE